jgi:hypothetical protein
LLESVTHSYPEKTVHLRFFRCAIENGDPQPLACQALAWVSRPDLARYAFPAGDAQLLAMLQARDELWHRGSEQV